MAEITSPVPVRALVLAHPAHHHHLHMGIGPGSSLLGLLWVQSRTFACEQLDPTVLKCGALMARLRFSTRA